MNSPALLIAQGIEKNLCDLYETLHKKERQTAAHINRYVEKKSINDRTRTLFINSILNLCLLAVLFYLLY